MVYLSKIFLEVFPKPTYSTMVTKKLQTYGVKVTSKYICESKKTESVYFDSCPQAKLSARFLSLPPKQKEITQN